MNPKVTVIMPSLNVVNYIEECLQSVINQTMEALEILCIDAGSTDGTLEILEKYAESDSRIKLLHSEKRSYGYQVNMGIKLAKGKYVAILETDDYVSNTMYEELYQQAIQYNLDYIKADYIRVECIEGENFQTPIKMFGGNEGVLYNKLISTLDIPELYWRDIHIWKGLYKKEFLIANHIFLNESSGAAYQDYGFGLLLHTNARRGMFVPQQYYYYRWGREGASSGNKNILKYSYQEFKRVLEEQLVQPTKEQKQQIYYRIAIDFPSEYSRVLKMVEYDINSEYLTAYYGWFKELLETVLHKGELTKQNGSEIFWAELKLLMESPADYAKYVRDKEIEKQQQIEALKADKIVIWGAGNYGLQAYKLLRGWGIHVEAIVDNDTKKWGSFLKSCPIQSPNAIVAEHKDMTYIIANLRHKKEIKEQLLHNGIKSEKIKEYEELT